MMIRLAGVLAVILGIGLAACAIDNLRPHAGKAVTRIASATIHGLPVSPEAYSTRVRILAAELAGCGILCAFSGIVLLMRRRWAIYVMAVAALIPLLLPPISRLVAPPEFRFDGPTLVDMLVFSLIGLVAALAFMLRGRMQ